MSYKLTSNDSVIRLSDGAWIPNDSGNADWVEYQAWLNADNTPEAADPPPRRAVAKSLIVQRLQDAGKLTGAQAALDADPYARERWYAADKPVIYADDQEAVAILTAIGADPEAILAP